MYTYIPVAHQTTSLVNILRQRVFKGGTAFPPKTKFATKIATCLCFVLGIPLVPNRGYFRSIAAVGVGGPPPDPARYIQQWWWQ